MSKPNKMGMSHEQLRKSRAARYGPKTDEEREQRHQDRRARSPELYALFDAIRDGMLTADEAAEKLRQFTESENS